MTTESSTNIKAVLLLSGGLDSTLVAELLAREGIQFLAVNYKTPFCQCDKHGANGCMHTAVTVSKRLGVECRVIDAGQDFLEVLKNPKHGYGSNMNPCQDCRILFFKKAKELMHEIGASYLVTGEVVGQRSMSQLKHQIALIESEADLEGMVVRPLSAQLLPPSIPEQNGWIKRENLLAFSGRSRKPQIALAKEYGLNDYPCAAGGCLLTVPKFADRVRDLKKYGPFDMDNIRLLKIGRHFRISPETKVIVGRNEPENEYLTHVARAGDHLFKTVDVMGPVALVRGVLTPQETTFTAGALSRYADSDNGAAIEISHRDVATGDVVCEAVLPLTDEYLQTFRL